MGIDRDRFLTISEAAQRSGYQYDHIRRLVKSGAVATLEIAAYKYLIDWQDLQRYMAEKPQRKPHRDHKRRPATERD